MLYAYQDYDFPIHFTIKNKETVRRQRRQSRRPHSGGFGNAWQLAHVDAESGLPLASKLEVSFGAENAIFAPFYAKVMIILPTQARDKPRVNNCG